MFFLEAWAHPEHSDHYLRAFEWVLSHQAPAYPTLYAAACVYHPTCEIHEVIFMVIGSMVNQALQ